MLDDILGFGVVAIPTVLGIAGWLMPINQSNRKHRWYLALIGAALSVLIFWQQQRAGAAHDREMADLKQVIGGIKKDSERPIQMPPVTVQIPTSVTFRPGPVDEPAALILEVDYDKHRLTTSGTWPGMDHKVPCDVAVVVESSTGVQEARPFRVTHIKNLGALAYIVVDDKLTPSERYLQIQDKRK